MAVPGLTVGGFEYGCQLLIHAVVSEVLPRKYRPYAQPTTIVPLSLGAICALFTGGALTRKLYTATSTPQGSALVDAKCGGM